jgi:outer membrane lipoprotein SlyB
MNSNSGQSNPIYLVAAIAIILFSVVGIGAITGLIPSTFSKNQPTEPAAAKNDPAPTAALQPQAPAVEPAPPPVAAAPLDTAPAAPPVEQTPPAAKPKVAKKPHVPSSPPKTTAPPDQVAVNEPPPAPPAPQFCRDCGVVESVNTVQLPGQGTGLGAIAGGILGGVLGHQVGSGRGNDVATAAGAIGGAVAGHQVEKSTKKKVQYDVVVRLEDNTAQTVHFQSDPGFRIGERVKLVDGQIVRN